MSELLPNELIELKINPNSFKTERLCIVCKEGFNLLGLNDPRTICPDCCKAIKSIMANSKSNWIPDSKGGEPNHRR